MTRNDALELILEEASREELIFPTNMAGSIRLQEALGHPECHLDVAADLVLAEPLIAARLVSIANSVAYTRYGGNVSNVRTAVRLVGLRPLRSLVTAIVIRQLSSEISDPALQSKSAMLWHHCANVASLAKVIAREFTDLDPEMAMFAGIVHEIDSFYLLSRVKEFPSLLAYEPCFPDAHPRLVHCILRTLKVPRQVAVAVEFLYSGELVFPPQTPGDVLLIANTIASTASPFIGWGSNSSSDSIPLPNFERQGNSLTDIVDHFYEEIKAMTNTLLI